MQHFRRKHPQHWRHYSCLCGQVRPGSGGCGCGSRDGGLWRTGKCGGIGPRGNESARVRFDPKRFNPWKSCCVGVCMSYHARRMAANPPWRRRGGGSEGRGWRLTLGAHHIRFCGAAGAPLRAASARPFSPCALSKNVSTGCTGPYLVKGRWWRGERACLRDAPPFLGNFLMPLSWSKITRTAC